MSDIVERLRDYAATGSRPWLGISDVFAESADTITAMRSLIADLCEAMEYAAGCDEGVDQDTAASDVMSWAGSPMAVAYTNARAALSPCEGAE